MEWEGWADSAEFAALLDAEVRALTEHHGSRLLADYRRRSGSSWPHLYAKHCMRPIEDVERNMERDFFMTPEQAKEWGLTDLIVERNPVAVTVS